MSESNKIIDDIIKAKSLFFKTGKVVTKIKMKEEFYSKLVVAIQKDYAIIEVLDVNHQPLNKIMGVKIEIDNTIKKDYEVIYD